MDIQFLVSKPLNDYGTVLIRCKQPSEFMSNLGMNVQVSNIRSLSLIRGGVIFFHRTGYNVFTKALAKAAKYSGNILVYDTDDLTLDNQGSKNFCELCHAVSVSTEFLKGEFSYYNKNIKVLKNCLSKRFLIESDKYNDKVSKTNEVTLGFFSGSSTHDNDFLIIEEAVIKILEKHRHVKFLICGKIKFSQRFYEFEKRFEYLPFMPYSEFIEIHRKVDILLVPMHSSKFNHGKSELKFIEAGAFCVPTIASSTYSYDKAIDHLKNGIIVSSPNKWFFWIEKLICESELRENIGQSARATVMEYYTPNLRGIEYKNWLKYLNDEVEVETKILKFYFYLLIAYLFLGIRILRTKFNFTWS